MALQLPRTLGMVVQGCRQKKDQMAEARKPRRSRLERGIYCQPNGKYAVCSPANPVQVSGPL